MSDRGPYEDLEDFVAFQMTMEEDDDDDQPSARACCLSCVGLALSLAALIVVACILTRLLWAD